MTTELTRFAAIKKFFNREDVITPNGPTTPFATKEAMGLKKTCSDEDVMEIARLCVVELGPEYTLKDALPAAS